LIDLYEESKGKHLKLDSKYEKLKQENEKVKQENDKFKANFDNEKFLELEGQTRTRQRQG
jgi:cell division protein FtsB